MNRAIQNFDTERDSAPPEMMDGNSRSRQWVVVVVACAIAGAGAILFFFKPGQYGFYPVCHFHSLTGLHCPGCGSSRALHELLHGNFIEALRLNALLLLGLAGSMWLAARYVLARSRRQRATLAFPARWLWLLLGLAVIFAVLRNIPAFAWLAP